MNRRATHFLLALVICVGVAERALPAERLTAGYSSISPAEWTLVTASKANLFEKYGLDVPLVYLGGSTRIVQVMIAGDIQIGQIGGSAALFGKAAGVDMAYIATTINSMAAQVVSRPEIKLVLSFMKAYLEAIKLNLDNKAFSKKVLAGYTAVTDDELLEIAYDVYILKIRSKVPYPVNKGWKTLIEFTARDNPKVRDVKSEEILDDSIMKELDDSGFIKSLGLRS
jgi:hypothetical protein